MDDLYNQLLKADVGEVKKLEPLKKHTTMKVGGPADLFIVPNTMDNISQLMKILKKTNVKWRAIGRGSNLLVHDTGIRGVVIHLGNQIDHLHIDDNQLTVGGGYSLIKLATIISKKGLSGLEFAGGIPGSVGGAVYMNAGAHGSDISQILKKAKIITENGDIKWLTKKEMEFSYRTSVLQAKNPGICIEAVFELEPGDRDEIVKKMQANKNYRKETQPWNYPCCGSVFRNPLPNHAGELIERAGLKGYSIGGAQVSELHANFIVNKGNATAEEVLQLIEHIKKVIFEKYEIEMETEVEIVGGS